MFTLETERFESITVLRFRGDMVLACAVELRQRLEREIKSSKPKDVVLDMSQVVRADTSGLGALVGACTNGKAMGKRLMLYGITPQVERLLEKAEISGFFPVLGDEHDLMARQLNKS